MFQQGDEYMRKYLLVMLVISMASVVRHFPLCAQHMQEIDVAHIVKTIDELYRSDASYAEMRMKIVTPHWQRTLEMKVWSSGQKKTMIRILSPPKEEGVGTLRIGNEMWNYLPKTNKVIKVPPSMMMSSWMGSDFNNNDLVREYTFLEDYTFSLIKQTPDSLTIRCKPKPERPIVWGKVHLIVRSRDYLPLRQLYYDEHGDVKRVLIYKKIRSFDGKTLPSQLELIPRDEKGNRTVLAYHKLNFRKSLPESVFSLRNLRTPE